jgi:hypothetical protein
MPESFTFPDETIKVIESLKRTFGVNSNAEVISRALGLARIISDKADAQNIVIVAGKDDQPVTLNLAK